MLSQWRGGGIAHGPVVRSHAHKLNRKVRRLGLLSALSVRPESSVAAWGRVAGPHPGFCAGQGCRGATHCCGQPGCSAAQNGSPAEARMRACGTPLDMLLSVQAVLDRHLDKLLADCPRRSVLMVDTDKSGPDGG